LKKYKKKGGRTILFHDITKLVSNINEEVSSNTGEVLTIVFGITSGLLTMVGLIAIFISLNTQQIMEKLRSEWWLLRELSDEAEQLLLDIEQGHHFDKKYLKELFLRLNRSLWNYEAVYNEKSSFMNSVIAVSLIILGSVIFLWAWAMRYFYLSESLSSSDYNLSLTSTLIGCSLLFIFGVFLFVLTIHKNVKFPNPSEFYDATKTDVHNTNTLLFACLSTRLITYESIEVNGSNVGEYEIFVDFQLPWKGLDIYYQVNGQAQFLKKHYSKYRKGALQVNEFVEAPKDLNPDPLVIKDKDGTEYSIVKNETKLFELIVEETSHKQFHYQVTFNIPEKDSGNSPYPLYVNRFKGSIFYNGFRSYQK
jgi:uncharacterized membrane protein